MSSHWLSTHERARGSQAWRAVDDPRRDHAVVHDRAFAVDIVHERVERPGALDQPRGELGPLVGGHDARQEVDGEEPGARLAGYAERDAVGALLVVAGLLAGAQPRGSERLQGRDDGLVVGADGPVVGDRLVTRRVVAAEERPGDRHPEWRGAIAPSLGEQEVDDVGHTASPPERSELLCGRAATARCARSARSDTYSQSPAASS